MISHTRYMLKEIIEHPSTHKTVEAPQKKNWNGLQCPPKEHNIDELSFNSETQIEGQPTNFFITSRHV